MKIDCIVTSWQRHDLLEKTLLSLLRDQEEVFSMIYIREDGIVDETKPILPNLYIKNSAWISGTHIGQVASIDHLMWEVRSEYYAHLEDDFMCVGNLKEGIEEAIEILENNPKCGSVSLRGPDKKDHNGHGYEEIDGVLRMKYGYGQFHGFSWAPSVRRLKDYHLIGSYGKHATFQPKKPWQAEADINKLYKDMGYWFATTKNKIFTHIGGGNLTTYGK